MLFLLVSPVIGNSVAGLRFCSDAVLEETTLGHGGGQTQKMASCDFFVDEI